MSRMNKIVAAAIVLAGFATTANAQTGATTVPPATATATIIEPITIEETRQMNFGNLAVTSTPGTAVLTAAGSTVRSATGGVSLPLGAQAGTVFSAEFTVTGAADNTYAITLPANSVVFLSGNGTDMGVDDFTTDKTNDAGLLSALGEDVFYVGATLTVAGSQAPGEYVGTYEVSVDYN